MRYQNRTFAFILLAGIALSYQPEARASRCLKSAEKQALFVLKKSGHSETLQSKNTKKVSFTEEVKKVYKLQPTQELFTTEIWEDESEFAVYDVLVESDTCRLKMVRAGGI